jgi:hypothetical protein
MSIIDIRGAAEAFISLPEPITMEDGRVELGPANLGQSVCVLSV